VLAIKLKRVGKKHQASFRIVVMEKRSKLQGRATEDLGWMNPHTKKTEINKERAKYWLGVGAQATPTVWNLLISAGVVEGKKIPVHKKPKAEKETAAAAAPASAEAVVVEKPAEAPAPAGEAAAT
jgi:small subunit ribosomal protein S16